MKKIFLVSAFLSFILFFIVFNQEASAKVLWGNMEIKPGQIGKATILHSTELWKLEKDDVITFARDLREGEEYRIYGYKDLHGGLYGLGGGYYVKKGGNVKYETPSKAKLAKLQEEIEYQKAIQNQVNPETILYLHKNNFKKIETDSVIFYGDQLIEQNYLKKYVNEYHSKIQPQFLKWFPDSATRIPKRKPTFVLLSTKDNVNKLVDSIGGHPEAWGWFTDNIIFLTEQYREYPYYYANDNLLAHEYFHWYLANVYRGDVPTWMNEGMAFIVGTAISEQSNHYLQSNHLNENLNKIKNFTGTIPNIYDTVYSDEWSEFGLTLLLSKYGIAKFEKLLVTTQNESFEDAFKKVYGFTFEQFNSNYKKEVEALR